MITSMKYAQSKLGAKIRKLLKEALAHFKVKKMSPSMKYSQSKLGMEIRKPLKEALAQNKVKQ